MSGSHKLITLVLSRCQPVSEAARGVTSKFAKPYEGPRYVTKIIPLSSYEISSANDKVCGVFHKQALKPYQEVQSELRSHAHVELLKTKSNEFHLKIQFVPRSKHLSPRL